MQLNTRIDCYQSLRFISLIFGFFISIGILLSFSWASPPLVIVPAVWRAPLLALRMACFFYESIDCLLSSPLLLLLSSDTFVLLN